MRARWWAASLVAVTLFPSAALAKTVQDPQEQNPAMVLDLASASANHFQLSGRTYWTFKITCHHDFSSSDLHWNEDHPPLLVGVQFDHDRAFERIIAIAARADASGYSLYASVTDHNSGHTPYEPSPSRARGYGEVWRPSTDSIKVKVPASLIVKKKLGHLRWIAQSSYSENPNEISFDYTDWVRQRT